MRCSKGTTVMIFEGFFDAEEGQICHLSGTFSERSPWWFSPCVVFGVFGFGLWGLLDTYVGRLERSKKEDRYLGKEMHAFVQ